MNSINPPPTLYDLASPNVSDPFQSSIDYTDRTPSIQHRNPKFLDLDDPGPTDQLSVPYENQIPSTGRIQQAILTNKEAAENRNFEANLLGNFLILGDFNLHHHWWHPPRSRSPSPGANPFVDWIDRNNFSLFSPVDIPTHNRGNFLDLAFGKGPYLLNTIYNIPNHIKLISDHLPLLTMVPWKRSAIPMQRLRSDELDTNLFKQLLASSITSLSPIPINPTPHTLDEFTEHLIVLVREDFT
ncbi:hypothetical protein EPUL_004471 [Erysiphe pulchra]|uniref:Endonuclease/exonuclease/phosphatase domain-containing protein n=1 Tax=Erysiphe pulchra TaxID=225359 RepID=A0A2S4PRK7_9PEZI|nr:hypothetical protein EPUL_004471 [Erysiphe pulchra]